MSISRRNFLGRVAAGYPVLQSVLIAQPTSDVERYVRFRVQDRIAYGLLEDERGNELKGSIFRRPAKSGKTYALDEVRLLAPCKPSKVMAVALNYASQFVTLYPGDVIYTGTPGETSPMKSGDVVEVEIEGVGVLKNVVA